jgi:hypothetical protein
VGGGMDRTTTRCTEKRIGSVLSFNGNIFWHIWLGFDELNEWFDLRGWGPWTMR